MKKRQRESSAVETETAPFLIYLGPQGLRAQHTQQKGIVSVLGFSFEMLCILKPRGFWPPIVAFQKLNHFGALTQDVQMKPQNLVLHPPTNRKLTTGCPILDCWLRGGVPCNSLTEFVAESGSGKTQLCLQLSLSVQLPISRGGLGGSSLYLHSEFPFPFRRLHQLSRAFHLSNPGIYIDHSDSPCDYVFVQSVHSADQLFDIMPKIESFVANSRSQFPLKLIVVDSIAALFRSDFDNTPSDLKKRSSLFFKISGKLKQLAKRFDLAVVVTNQVVDLVEPSEGINGLRVGNMRALLSSGRRVVPALGLAWANCVNSRLFLSRSDDIVCKENRETDENGNNVVFRRTQRQLHVVFSPHLPDSSCELVITREGIFGVH